MGGLGTKEEQEGKEDEENKDEEENEEKQVSDDEMQQVGESVEESGSGRPLP